MSSDSTDEGKFSLYAYVVLRIFPPFPTKIVILRHRAETNDMFLPCGRVGPSPFTKMNKVEIFLLETLILQIGFRLPFDDLIYSVQCICIGNKLLHKIISKLNIIYTLHM